ncbi:hypothetical protein [Gordonia neofelifaecis]|uniref:Pyrrolo-quinoline quinone beta-propeller repeat-containing protein n=1 Tax=Gordonia neofelifaecis NRRL B-59395 TaxID=644548 RepID=F1YLJ3_9ACTN|nr:hypothetical protein [Gordonia neofelifaecis]EGD54387.1 pyrrolo-quinoline quinone beta-propeller repeat-containing protein [Gordonia neofelifaecis NRRL B-59395]
MSSPGQPGEAGPDPAEPGHDESDHAESDQVESAESVGSEPIGGAEDAVQTGTMSSGVDHYAETMSRPIPAQTPPVIGSGTRSYPAGSDPSAPYPTSPYEAGQYSANQYPSGPSSVPTGYPSGPPPTGYPAYGYQQQPSSGGAGRAVLLGVAIALVIGLAVAAVVVWMKVIDSGGDTAAPAPQTVAQEPPTHTVTSVVTDPESDAAGRLRDQSIADAAFLRAGLDGRWAAQISAKRPGLYAEGRTWDNQAILAEFQSSRSRYPQVRLIDSGQWPVFSESGWWVTVSAQNFADPAAALAWCSSNGLDRDHCFAKLISSSQGPEGSTLYQK